MAGLPALGFAAIGGGGGAGGLLMVTVRKARAEKGRALGRSPFCMTDAEAWLFFGDGLRDGVGLVVDEALLGFDDLVAGEGGIAPAA